MTRTGRTLHLAFVSAVVSLMAVFAAVGSTIPLFNIYRAEDGFTNADISLTVVAYSAATLSTLMVFGRLSNHLGRRPTAIASLGLLVLGCLLLLNLHDIGTLIAGRLLMGLGAGLASSNVTAYIVDAAPARPSLAGLRRLQSDSHARSCRRRHSLRCLGPVRPVATSPHLPGCRRHAPAIGCARRYQPGDRNADSRCLAFAASQGSHTGQAHASAPRRGGGVRRDVGDRGLLPGFRPRTGRRSTPHQ